MILTISGYLIILSVIYAAHGYYIMSGKGFCSKGRSLFLLVYNIYNIWSNVL